MRIQRFSGLGFRSRPLDSFGVGRLRRWSPSELASWILLLRARQERRGKGRTPKTAPQLKFKARST
jgi:hypothetical protein